MKERNYELLNVIFCTFCFCVQVRPDWQFQDVNQDNTQSFVRVTMYDTEALTLGLKCISVLLFCYCVCSLCTLCFSIWFWIIFFHLSFVSVCVFPSTRLFSCLFNADNSFRAKFFFPKIATGHVVSPASMAVLLQAPEDCTEEVRTIFCTLLPFVVLFFLYFGWAVLYFCCTSVCCVALPIYVSILCTFFTFVLFVLSRTFFNVPRCLLFPSLFHKRRANVLLTYLTAPYTAIPLMIQFFSEDRAGFVLLYFCSFVLPFCTFDLLFVLCSRLPLWIMLAFWMSLFLNNAIYFLFSFFSLRTSCFLLLCFVLSFLSDNASLLFFFMYFCFVCHFAVSIQVLCWIVNYKIFSKVCVLNRALFALLDKIPSTSLKSPRSPFEWTSAPNCWRLRLVYWCMKFVLFCTLYFCVVLFCFLSCTCVCASFIALLTWNFVLQLCTFNFCTLYFVLFSRWSILPMHFCSRYSPCRAKLWNFALEIFAPLLWRCCCLLSD